MIKDISREEAYVVVASHYLSELEVAHAEIARLRKALRLITEMDGDQPARSDWDMLRIAFAALEHKS